MKTRELSKEEMFSIFRTVRRLIAYSGLIACGRPQEMEDFLKNNTYERYLLHDDKEKQKIINEFNTEKNKLLALSDKNSKEIVNSISIEMDSSSRLGLNEKLNKVLQTQEQRNGWESLNDLILEYGQKSKEIIESEIGSLQDSLPEKYYDYEQCKIIFEEVLKALLEFMDVDPREIVKESILLSGSVQTEQNRKKVSQELVFLAEKITPSIKESIQFFPGEFHKVTKDDFAKAFKDVKLIKNIEPKKTSRKQNGGCFRRIYLDYTTRTIEEQAKQWLNDAKAAIDTMQQRFSHRPLAEVHVLFSCNEGQEKHMAEAARLHEEATEIYGKNQAAVVQAMLKLLREDEQYQPYRSLITPVGISTSLHGGGKQAPETSSVIEQLTQIRESVENGVIVIAPTNPDTINDPDHPIAVGGGISKVFPAPLSELVQTTLLDIEAKHPDHISSVDAPVIDAPQVPENDQEEPKAVNAQALFKKYKELIREYENNRSLLDTATDLKAEVLQRLRDDLQSISDTLPDRTTIDRVLKNAKEGCQSLRGTKSRLIPILRGLQYELTQCMNGPAVIAVNERLSDTLVTRVAELVKAGPVNATKEEDRWEVNTIYRAMANNVDKATEKTMRNLWFNAKVFTRPLSSPLRTFQANHAHQFLTYVLNHEKDNVKKGKIDKTVNMDHVRFAEEMYKKLMACRSRETLNELGKEAMDMYAVLKATDSKHTGLMQLLNALSKEEGEFRHQYELPSAEDVEDRGPAHRMKEWDLAFGRNFPGKDALDERRTRLLLEQYAGAYRLGLVRIGSEIHGDDEWAIARRCAMIRMLCDSEYAAERKLGEHLLLKVTPQFMEQMRTKYPVDYRAQIILTELRFMGVTDWEVVACLSDPQRYGCATLDDLLTNLREVRSEIKDDKSGKYAHTNKVLAYLDKVIKQLGSLPLEIKQVKQPPKFGEEGEILLPVQQPVAENTSYAASTAQAPIRDEENYPPHISVYVSEQVKQGCEKRLNLIKQQVKLGLLSLGPDSPLGSDVVGERLKQQLFLYAGGEEGSFEDRQRRILDMSVEAFIDCLLKTTQPVFATAERNADEWLPIEHDLLRATAKEESNVPPTVNFIYFNAPLLDPAHPEFDYEFVFGTKACPWAPGDSTEVASSKANAFFKKHFNYQHYKQLFKENMLPALINKNNANPQGFVMMLPILAFSDCGGFAGLLSDRFKQAMQELILEYRFALPNLKLVIFSDVTQPGSQENVNTVEDIGQGDNPLPFVTTSWRNNDLRNTQIGHGKNIAQILDTYKMITGIESDFGRHPGNDDFNKQVASVPAGKIQVGDVNCVNLNMKHKLLLDDILCQQKAETKMARLCALRAALLSSSDPEQRLLALKMEADGLIDSKTDRLAVRNNPFYQIELLRARLMNVKTQNEKEQNELVDKLSQLLRSDETDIMQKYNTYLTETSQGLGSKEKFLSGVFTGRGLFSEGHRLRNFIDKEIKRIEGQLEQEHKQVFTH